MKTDSGKLLRTPVVTDSDILLCTPIYRSEYRNPSAINQYFLVVVEVAVVVVVIVAVLVIVEVAVV